MGNPTSKIGEPAWKIGEIMQVKWGNPSSKMGQFCKENGNPASKMGNAIKKIGKTWI